MRQVTHALLTRPPLSHKIFNPEGNQIKCFVRLACVKHAASVHPEPGSNSHVKKFNSESRKNLAFPCFRICNHLLASDYLLVHHYAKHNFYMHDSFTVLRFATYRCCSWIFSKSFKVISLISYQCSFAVFSATALIAYHIFDRLSTTFFIFFNFIFFSWYETEKEGFEPSRRC